MPRWTDNHCLEEIKQYPKTHPKAPTDLFLPKLDEITFLKFKDGLQQRIAI
jgi:hypothetical protein